MTDLGYDIIPPAFFVRRVVQQNAMNECARKVAAVVPDILVVKSRYDKKPSGDAPVHGSGGWQNEMLPEKRSRRVPIDVGHRIHGQVGTTIACLKAAAIASIRRTCILRENVGGKLDIRARLGDDVLLPSDGLR
jgi:hypothetical protein